MINEKLKNEILTNLKPLNLEKVILFGSHAYGTPHENSDVDLYIVTKDDFMPQNFEEKTNVYLKVSNTLKKQRKSVDIDLIVHTKKMYEKFITINSLFAREIMHKGITLNA